MHADMLISMNVPPDHLVSMGPRCVTSVHSYSTSDIDGNREFSRDQLKGKEKKLENPLFPSEPAENRSLHQ